MLPFLFFYVEFLPIFAIHDASVVKFFLGVQTHSFTHQVSYQLEFPFGEILGAAEFPTGEKHT
jgi:hypothetical protein